MKTTSVIIAQTLATATLGQSQITSSEIDTSISAPAGSLLISELTTDPQESEELFVDESAVSGTEADLPEFDEPRWDHAAHRRFRNLAVKEAKGEITHAELVELESLDRLRESQIGAPSGKEYLHQLKARKLKKELIDIVRRYVDFYHPGQKAPHYSASRAKTKAN